MTKNREKNAEADTATPATTVQEAAAPASAPATTPTPVIPAASSIEELRAQGLSAVRLPIDPHHNKGGTFVIRGGVRVPL